MCSQGATMSLPEEKESNIQCFSLSRLLTEYVMLCRVCVCFLLNVRRSRWSDSKHLCLFLNCTARSTVLACTRLNIKAKVLRVHVFVKHRIIFIHYFYSKNRVHFGAGMD